MRTSNGYRSYDDQHRKWLQFILRTRALGFTQDEVHRLTEIAHMTEPVCGDVHTIFTAHASQIQEKIRDLRKMESALIRLNTKCKKGTLNECPVIDELMGQVNPGP